jgi:glycosyltransferase involved in cell wall biosynthesis
MATLIEKRNSSQKDISVILPVFNEESTISELVHEVVEILSKGNLDFEVVVVDDGSNDQTLNVLRDVKHNLPEVLRVAHHLNNKGNGAALRTGIRVARGEVVVTMDADGQHSPTDILQLIELIPPYDLVIGARTENYQGSWYRNLANRFYNRFASWLSRTEVKDLTSGFRAMRRSAVEHFLPLFPDGFSAPTTTTLAFLKAGYNVEFLPIKVRQRESGKSKIRLVEDGSRFVMIILRMVMLFDPLRIFFPSGIALFLLGIIAWVAGLANAGRIVFPNSTIFLFSTAILIWFLGLLSDQMANTRIVYHGDEHTVFLNED